MSASPLAVNSVVEGTVTGITNFGAFVLLPNGQTGLVHISEVANVFVRDIHDHLEENQKVMVKVLSCDERGRVALSIKQADPDYRPPRPRSRFSDQSFEDKLSRFLRESEEKQTDLRRLDAKRGGRGGRSYR